MELVLVGIRSYKGLTEACIYSVLQIGMRRIDSRIDHSYVYGSRAGIDIPGLRNGCFSEPPLINGVIIIRKCIQLIPRVHTNSINVFSLRKCLLNLLQFFNAFLFSKTQIKLSNGVPISFVGL